MSNEATTYRLPVRMWVRAKLHRHLRTKAWCWFQGLKYAEALGTPWPEFARLQSKYAYDRGVSDYYLYDDFVRPIRELGRLRVETPILGIEKDGEWPDTHLRL